MIRLVLARLVWWALIAGALMFSGFAHADLTTALDRYLAGLESWRAEFSQSLTDSRGRTRGVQRGRLLIHRPGKFRWEIGPAIGNAAQLMVADGRNVWFLDSDLDQVTVRPAGSGEAATPAMLLSGSTPLRSKFRVEAAGRKDGFAWVRVSPKTAPGEFKEMRFGFVGLDLRRLEIDDKLGQRAVMIFEISSRNGRIDPSEFRFVPPPGVDVIGKPSE
ncbi:MAG: outer membrane lipoprotein chaperone LolA [Gammaproteobacteria bacterium]|nr:outer membrane lipoprotein chaperone LolA [Gammaproteobacteria bacterium]